MASYTNLTPSVLSGALWSPTTLPWALALPWTTPSGIISYTNLSKTP